MPRAQEHLALYFAGLVPGWLSTGGGVYGKDKPGDVPFANTQLSAAGEEFVDLAATGAARRGVGQRPSDDCG